MRERQRFLFDVRRSLIVYVGTDQAPDDESWETYAAAVDSRCAQFGSVRILGFVGAGVPTPLQRKRLMNRLGPVEHRVALVTASVAARSLMTVFSWLGAKIRAFTPEAVDDATRYLELEPADAIWALQTERRLRPQLEAR